MVSPNPSRRVYKSLLYPRYPISTTHKVINHILFLLLRYSGTPHGARKVAMGICQATCHSYGSLTRWGHTHHLQNQALVALVCLEDCMARMATRLKCHHLCRLQTPLVIQTQSVRHTTEPSASSSHLRSIHSTATQLCFKELGHIHLGIQRREVVYSSILIHQHSSHHT